MSKRDIFAQSLGKIPPSVDSYGSRKSLQLLWKVRVFRQETQWHMRRIKGPHSEAPLRPVKL